MPENSLDKLATEMHEVVHELVKKYQFRNRNQICCYDLSVSQCYVMHELKSQPLTMRSLAERMHLDISTMTRVVDQLHKKNYVQREQDESDRRIVYVSLSATGARLLAEIEAGLIATERTILEKFSPEARQNVLTVLHELLYSVEDWRQSCCVPATTPGKRS